MKKVIIKLFTNNVFITGLPCFIPAFTDYKVTPISDMMNIKTIVAGSKITKPIFLFNSGYDCDFN